MESIQKIPLTEKLRVLTLAHSRQSVSAISNQVEWNDSAILAIISQRDNIVKCHTPVQGEHTYR